MSKALLRLRGRLGWWLIQPYANAAMHKFYDAHKSGDSTGDYGPDYWLIKWFGLNELKDACRRGVLHQPWRYSEAGPMWERTQAGGRD